MRRLFLLSQADPLFPKRGKELACFFNRYRIRRSLPWDVLEKVKPEPGELDRHFVEIDGKQFKARSMLPVRDRHRTYSF